MLYFVYVHNPSLLIVCEKKTMLCFLMKPKLPIYIFWPTSLLYVVHHKSCGAGDSLWNQFQNLDNNFQPRRNWIRT